MHILWINMMAWLTFLSLVRRFSAVSSHSFFAFSLLHYCSYVETRNTSSEINWAFSFHENWPCDILNCTVTLTLWLLWLYRCTAVSVSHLVSWGGGRVKKGQNLVNLQYLQRVYAMNPPHSYHLARKDRILNGATVPGSYILFPAWKIIHSSPGTSQMSQLFVASLWVWGQPELRLLIQLPVLNDRSFVWAWDGRETVSERPSRR